VKLFTATRWKEQNSRNTQRCGRSAVRELRRKNPYSQQSTKCSHIFFRLPVTKKNSSYTTKVIVANFNYSVHIFPSELDMWLLMFHNKSRWSAAASTNPVELFQIRTSVTCSGINIFCYYPSVNGQMEVITEKQVELKKRASNHTCVRGTGVSNQIQLCTPNLPLIKLLN
jgi:hypothetical protein